MVEILVTSSNQWTLEEELQKNIRSLEKQLRNLGILRITLGGSLERGKSKEEKLKLGLLGKQLSKQFLVIKTEKKALFRHLLFS